LSVGLILGVLNWPHCIRTERFDPELYAKGRA